MGFVSLAGPPFNLRVGGVAPTSLIGAPVEMKVDLSLYELDLSARLGAEDPFVVFRRGLLP